MIPNKYFYDESKQKIGKGFEIVDATLLPKETLEKAKLETKETFSNSSSKEYVLDALDSFIKGDCDGFIAFYNGIIVGAISFTENKDFIELVYIGSNISGKDVGKLLVDEVIKTSKQSKKPIVSSIDLGSVGFYEKMGFTYLDEPELQNKVYPIYIREIKTYVTLKTKILCGY